MGSAATFSDSASQLAFVWIARQSSSQRETTAPVCNWARNWAGTANRPLPSTECRYSPVNTCGLPLSGSSASWALIGRLGRVVSGSVRERPRELEAFPTLRHFAPLRCILANDPGEVNAQIRPRPGMARGRRAAVGGSRVAAAGPGGPGRAAGSRRIGAALGPRSEVVGPDKPGSGQMHLGCAVTDARQMRPAAHICHGSTPGSVVVVRGPPQAVHRVAVTSAAGCI